MAGQVREGWYADPADRHEYRWFSEGSPTDLVKDGRSTSTDAVGIADSALHQAMDLQQPPDDGPLLVTNDQPAPEFEVNFGSRPVSVVNTAGRRTDLQPVMQSAATVEIVVVFLPFFAGVLLLRTGAPVGVSVALVLLSPGLAVLGYSRRRRGARRFGRAASQSARGARAAQGPADTPE